MKKQFTKYLITTMAVCTAIIILLVFVIQYAMVRSTKHESAVDSNMAVAKMNEENARSMAGAAERLYHMIENKG